MNDPGPLLADPKEPRSFVSWLRGTFRSLDDPSGSGTTIGSVGIGDSFGLVRWNGGNVGDGFQIDFVGSIFAQFDLGAPSNDLINADYIIGIPVTVRKDGFSIGTHLYHQSSHLGDEYLLWRRRTRLFPRAPIGGGKRSPRVGIQVVGGVDVKASEQFDWSPATSGRVGLQFARSGGDNHRHDW